MLSQNIRLIVFILLVGRCMFCAFGFMISLKQRQVGLIASATSISIGSDSGKNPAVGGISTDNEKKDRVRERLGLGGREKRYSKATKGNDFGSARGKRVIRPQGKKRPEEMNNPNLLRIIAGSAKGKKILSPNVYLRPMMGKVREALFSTLTSMGLFDTSSTLAVMDTFSGSGSVGLEALSRGAEIACFVDFSKECTDTALRNADLCGFIGGDKQVSAVCARTQDVFLQPNSYGLSRPFGLITITPPYQEVLYKELIDAICESPLVAEDTVLVIEYPRDMGLMPPVLGGDKFVGIRNRKYGRTMLGIYIYRPSEQQDIRPLEFGSESSTFGSGERDFT